MTTMTRTRQSADERKATAHAEKLASLEVRARYTFKSTGHVVYALHSVHHDVLCDAHQWPYSRLCRC